MNIKRWFCLGKHNHPKRMATMKELGSKADQICRSIALNSSLRYLAEISLTGQPCKRCGWVNPVGLKK